MDIEFSVMRWAIRRWRLAALLVIAFVPGALGLYLSVYTNHFQHRFERRWEQMMDHLPGQPTAPPTPSPARTVR